MRQLILSLSIIFGSALYLPAKEDVCYNQDAQLNICELANELREQIASELPQRLSKNLILRTISSEKNILWLNTLLLYDSQFLDNFLKDAGMTRKDLNKLHFDFTKNSMCSTPQTKAFIELGGQLIVSYKLGNGEHLWNIELESCQ